MIPVKTIYRKKGKNALVNQCPGIYFCLKLIDEAPSSLKLSNIQYLWIRSGEKPSKSNLIYPLKTLRSPMSINFFFLSSSHIFR